MTNRVNSSGVSDRRRTRLAPVSDSFSSEAQGLYGRRFVRTAQFKKAMTAERTPLAVVVPMERPSGKPSDLAKASPSRSPDYSDSWFVSDAAPCSL